ncbi:uncharacterized protein LOC144348071 [Saccoglossus kowalevskii]
MGCVASRLSGDSATVSPATKPDTVIKVDTSQRADAAIRRHKTVQQKHKEAASKATVISNIALEEKERLSVSMISSRIRTANGVIRPSNSAKVAPLLMNNNIHQTDDTGKQNTESLESENKSTNISQRNATSTSKG